LVPSSRADFILVNKSERTLSLWKDGKLIRSYRVALGGNPRGHKVEEGDGRTPEGKYRIDRRNAGSAFYRALHISYPNAADRQRASRNRVAPGGDIMIHGIKNGFGWLGPLHRLVDWTNGCIAVTDEEMREIWDAVPDNTVIEIRP
jgi:murein L,D-transpeptidase YafK